MKPTDMYNKINENIKFKYIPGLTLSELRDNQKKIENEINKLNDMDTIEHIPLMRPYFIINANRNLEDIKNLIGEREAEERVKKWNLKETERRRDNRDHFILF
jgi:hypothetical protein